MTEKQGTVRELQKALKQFSNPDEQCGDWSTFYLDLLLNVSEWAEHEDPDLNEQVAELVEIEKRRLGYALSIYSSLEGIDGLFLTEDTRSALQTALNQKKRQ